MTGVPIQPPERRLLTTAWWCFVISLLFAPVAFVPLVLGAILASKGQAGRGAVLMILSVFVLVAWGVILADALSTR